MLRAAPPLRLVAAAAGGGALGALLRWVLGELVPDGSGFPWTTFGINVVGSFVLATLPAFEAIRRSRMLVVGLGTGVLGGFTTLSATSEQSRALLAAGRAGLAAAYLLATLAACLAAVALAHRWSTPFAQHMFEDEEGNE